MMGGVMRTKAADILELSAAERIQMVEDICRMPDPADTR